MTAVRPLAKEILFVGGGFTVLLVLFFLTPILRGELLSPADLLLRAMPWRQTMPSDFEPANSLLGDYVLQFRPWRAFTVAALKEGRIPLWNPYNYAGAPFLGNGQLAVLYPLNAFFVALPEAAAVLLWAIARLLIAGLSAYLFARIIGLSVLGASMTSLSFTFSGFLVVWLLWPHVNVAIGLPALFLAGEGIVRHPKLSRMPVFACIVCIQFLGGHPATSLHILSAVGLYMSWRMGTTLRDERDWRRLGYRLAAFAGAVVLGTGGAAVQLLPLGEYILQSEALRERLALAPSLWSLPQPRLLAMIALVCPYCLGSRLRGDVPLDIVPGIDNFNELNGGYVGLLSLFLAGIAIALRARRGIDLFFVVLGGLAFCVAYTIPPVSTTIHALPLFRVSANTRSLLLLAFALSVLAGRGVDLLMTAPEAKVRHILKAIQKLVAITATGVALIAACLLLGVIGFGDKLLEKAGGWAIAKATIEGYQQVPEQFLALLPRYYNRLVPLLIWRGTGLVVLLVLSALAISLAAGLGRMRHAFAWALPGVLILDLFSFGQDYNPSIPPRLAYPSHEAIEILRAQPGLFRVLALNGGMPPNTNLLYGLSEVRGYDALETEFYHRFLAATGSYPEPYRHFRTRFFSNFESRLIDLLNVKYLISDRELQHQKLMPVWKGDGSVNVYENRAALPRAFLAYRTRVLDSKQELERALRDPDFDPASLVLLEEGPVLSGPADLTPTVTIIEYLPERVLVQVSSDYDGILVLGDAWFPGWEVEVDGTPTKLLRANLLLRAVPIPAGSHQVSFQYDPASFWLGLMVSGSALVIIVLLRLMSLGLRKQHGG